MIPKSFYSAMILPLFLAGCSVQMVSTRGANQGTIRYSLSEHLSQNQRQREAAYKQVHAYCNGPYRIAREGNQPTADSGVSSQLSRVTHSSSDQSAYWYFDFECLSAENSAPLPTDHTQ